MSDLSCSANDGCLEFSQIQSCCGIRDACVQTFAGYGVGWRDKARAVLIRKPSDPDAERLIAALAIATTQPVVEGWISTGFIALEPGGNDRPICLGCEVEVEVARIFKNATHAANRKRICAVAVMGAALQGRFHHIRDPRQADGNALQRQRYDPST
jgi:hypothetical protein